MTQSPADPLVGATIAQYEILARIGGGGMGVVYAARDTRLGRRVALKFLPPQWSHDDAAKQRFVREAQAASATDHPNICTIHDIAETPDGRLFIVMAHYDGQTLKQMLDAGPLEVEAAVEIAAQAAEGLAKAHAHGVVHRDIKPGNLMVSGDVVKILDFGLAKFATALQLTLEHSTLGTAAYMSPEQVKGEEADARSDVWALGVVLYEMLAGHVPFQGAYAEAIGYAIRNETPTPLRVVRPEIPEALEQIVFRALHKDPSIRYQSGRELARALRGLQGRSIPEDLLTVPIQTGTRPSPPLPRPLATPAPRRWRVWAAAAAVIVMIGVPFWMFSPVTPVPVAVVPVVNQTGYAELDPYRMALTQELIAQLADSHAVRVLPYERLLQIVRRFRGEGRDVSSREAVEAIRANSTSQVLVVPTLLYDASGWKARLEFRDPQTATNLETYETPPVVSSLMKEAVYRLTPTLAAAIDDYFVASGPARANLRQRVAGWFGDETPRPQPLTNLDAALAFEQGLDAYEQQEYASARDAFASAAERDPRHPLPVAWQSRTALLMRQDKDAAEAADRAVQLVERDASPSRRAFVTAVAAESRRDLETAASAYRDLAALDPESPDATLELAGFLDRSGDAAEAVTTYHRALELDERQIRPHLELCRLYSPSRLNEPAMARQHGETALERYRALGNAGGEVQALWCLADVLRVGGQAERREAMRHAQAALATVERLGYAYNLGRAYNYVALVAWAQRNGAEASVMWERALTASRAAGNVFLESRILMNLGVTQEMLGERADALKYYEESFAGYEALGLQQEAAWNRANAAAIRIQYGGDHPEALRDLQNALAVFQKFGDKDFEAFTRQSMSWYYRYAGDRDAARRELTLASTIARERDLDTRVIQVAIDLARLDFDAGAYAAARDALTPLTTTASATDRVHALIELGRTQSRLGQFEAAAAVLSRAAAYAAEVNDVGSLPLLYFAQGELAYEAGRSAEAAPFFIKSAAAWTGDMPEAASVESRAYEGLIAGLSGQGAEGERALRAALRQAEAMRRPLLAARCRLFLARLAAARGRPGEALALVREIPADLEQRLDPELQAQVQYSRGMFLRASGDAAAAARDVESARAVLDRLIAALPEADRAGVRQRPGIRLITTDLSASGNQ